MQICTSLRSPVHLTSGGPVEMSQPVRHDLLSNSLTKKHCNNLSFKYSYSCETHSVSLLLLSKFIVISFTTIPTPTILLHGL